MADEEAFNSSDKEFEAPPQQGDHYGLKSIETMLQTVFEDRVASKKASKHLTDDVGSPMSRAHKFLVYNRFKAFYTATLKKRYVCTYTISCFGEGIVTSNKSTALIQYQSVGTLFDSSSLSLRT